MTDIAKEVREHIGHQWSDRTFVQSEKVRDIMRRAAEEIERLRRALSDARPFVADAGDDEDPDSTRAASEVVAEIDRLIPSR